MADVIMTDSSQLPPLRVLFLCTHNSARSQIAEALLERKGRGRRRAEKTHLIPVT